MYQKLPYLFFTFLLLQFNSAAQKIIYSAFEKMDFNRFKFDVITKHNDQLLIYKATYYVPPFSVHDPSNKSSPRNSIAESSICMYDSGMNILQRIHLPLPKEISGVHFLVYDGFFYMFYQYLKGHTVYCMAARINFEGKMIGIPFEMDKTTIADPKYQSQVYSVIYSESKKYIIAFKLEQHGESGAVLTSLLFDDNLQIINKYVNTADIPDLKFLTEFQADNNGNLIFIGVSGSSKSVSEVPPVLFRLNRNSKAISYENINTEKLNTDYIRLVIDNEHKKNILVSLYSNSPGGYIDGLQCIIKDAETNNTISTVNTIFADSIRKIAGVNGLTAFNNYYIQNIQLGNNGSFVVHLQELTSFPYNRLTDRWNYREYLPDQVASDFIFYDPYEHDHYYPWKEWQYTDGGNNYSFNSAGSLLISFSKYGAVEWISRMSTPQKDILHVAIGANMFIMNNLLYILFNENIKNKIFLSAQSINSSGEINTDKRLKEDLDLKNQDNTLLHFPGFAKQISTKELVLPCRIRKGYICLAKIEF